MIKKIGSLALAILLLAGLLAGCGGGGNDPALVGTWAWDETSSWEWVFEADGSGTRGVQGHQQDSFEWSTNGSRVTLRVDSNRERWDFAVDGDNLTMSSGNVTYAYSRVGRDTALTGEWAWDEDGSFIFDLGADGQGTRGFVPSVESFEWTTTADGRLTLWFGAQYQEWNYSFDGGVMTIVNTRFANEVYSYVRLEQNAAFIGTWAWDEDDDFEYVFSADGTATRGFSSDIVSFEWATAANGQIIMWFDTHTESWQYSFDGDLLTIDSNQNPMVWSYIRVSE